MSTVRGQQLQDKLRWFRRHCRECGKFITWEFRRRDMAPPTEDLICAECYFGGREDGKQD